MEIRSYYWNARKVSFSKYLYLKMRGRYSGLQLRHGNAGDIFNRDLIRWLYGANPRNISDEGRRLLIVGSVMNVIRPNDVLCGIGWKGNQEFDHKNILNTCLIYGLRGPLTYDVLKRNNVKLDQIKFLLDPGLLIKRVYGIKTESYEAKDVVFIPHYREYGQYLGKRLPKGILLMKVDSRPKRLAISILQAKLVFTSSLHVIVFSHALNRPCIFVRPQTEEPLFKYQDYFASVDLDYPRPLDNIYGAKFQNIKDSPIHISKDESDFYFPDITKLREQGVIV